MHNNFIPRGGSQHLQSFWDLYTPTRYDKQQPILILMGISRDNPKAAVSNPFLRTYNK